jgi:lysophospholipase L1-like esterase
MRIVFFGDSLTAGIPGASYFDRLCRMLPDHELVNYARGGDSVIGAHERISRLGSDESFEMAFLWIGTNDVFVKVSRTFPLIRRLLRQPWARSTDEFTRYYRSILDNLHCRAKRVNAVSPWFVGEDVDSEWNRELEELSAEVKALSSAYENVQYIDLRAVFRPQLVSTCVSRYVADGAIGVVRDALMFRDLTRIDQISSQRRLQYTLDGVHLNGRGAEIVAGIFAEVVDRVVA